MPIAQILEIAWWLFTTAAISFGINYLGGIIFGQDLKEAEPPQDASERIWDPHTTQSEGLPWTRAYGKNLHHGNVIGKWTDVDGNEREILYLIIEHGDGPTKGNVPNQIFLKDQPISNFSGVTVQERRGTLNQTCPTGFEKNKLEHTPNMELLQNETYTWTTPNDFFDDIEYTVAFLNGLVKYHKDGGSTTGTISLRVRISEHDKDDWTTLFESTISACQTQALFKKYTVSEQGFTCVRGKQYDLEFKRTTPVCSTRHVDNSHVRSIREVVDVPFRRPGKALTAIKAVATSELSGSLDVKVIRKDRLVNVYDGSNWNIEYTRNRAWIVFDILTRPVISGDGQTGTPYKIESYDGIDPSYMDVEFFYDWSVLCGSQVLDGYGGTEDCLPCDIKIDYETDVWTVARDIAEIGRAHLYWQGNVLTGWIDKAVSGPTDLVTHDNMTGKAWKNDWTKPKELAGGVQVFIEDERQGYERVPVPFSNSSAGNYKRIISIEGVGVKTYGTAIRVANFALKRNQLIRNVNGFRQYKDAVRYKLGDVVRLQSKVAGWGKNYRVVSMIDSNTVDLDREVKASPGEAFYVRTFNSATGNVSVDSYVVQSVSGTEVTVQGTWSIDPIKGNIVAIGSTVLRRITKMEIRPDNYYDVTVETYDATLYDADSIDPDAPNKNFIWTQPAGAITKPVTREEVLDIISQLMPPQPDIEIPWPSNIGWTGNEVDTIYWDSRAATADDQELLFRYRGVTYEITPGYTTDEFVYWDPNYTTTFKTTNLASVALAPGNWLMCQNKDGVAYPCIPFQIIHGAVIQAGTITASYGQIADAAIETAKIQNAAVETLKIKGNAVTVPSDAFTSVETSVGESWYDVQTLEFTATGQPIFIVFSLLHRPGSNAYAHVRLLRDSTELISFGPVIGFSSYYVSVSHTYNDQPSADTYTYKIQCKADSGSINISKRSLFIIETKR